MKLGAILWLIHVSVVSGLTLPGLRSRGSVGRRNRCNTVAPTSFLDNLRIREESMALSVNPLSQEDLPNLLGINPIEGTLIFGTLYYFYGPTKLYEFAREAGKFVSTYGPVAKEVTTSVFEEFKEYLEEEGEREQLSSAGIDISTIERRTTNIFERFQASLDEFSQMTNPDDAAGELKGAYAQDLDEDGDDISIKKRKKKKKKGKFKKVKKGESDEIVRMSKRELLEKREVDVDAVMDATEKMSGSLDGDEGFAESVNTVKDKIDQIKTGPVSDVSFPANPTNGEVPSAALIQQQMQLQAMQMQAEKAEAEETSNRFQQQMDVSAWNKKVMQGSSLMDSQGMGSGFTDDTGDTGDFDPILGTDSQKTVDEFGWPIPEEGNHLDMNIEATQLPLDEEWSNIPQELSVSDSSEEMSMMQTSGVSTAEESLAMDVLKELDRDYSALRQRLVDLIEKQADTTIVAAETAVVVSPEGIPAVKALVEGEKKRYWPPSSDYKNKN